MKRSFISSDSYAENLNRRNFYGKEFLVLSRVFEMLLAQFRKNDYRLFSHYKKTYLPLRKQKELQFSTRVTKACDVIFPRKAVVFLHN